MNIGLTFINQNMAVNGKRQEAVQVRLDGNLVTAEVVDDSLLKDQIELAIMAKQCNERSLVGGKMNILYIAIKHFQMSQV